MRGVIVGDCFIASRWNEQFGNGRSVQGRTDDVRIKSKGTKKKTVKPLSHLGLNYPLYVCFFYKCSYVELHPTINKFLSAVIRALVCKRPDRIPE